MWALIARTTTEPFEPPQPAWWFGCVRFYRTAPQPVRGLAPSMAALWPARPGLRSVHRTRDLPSPGSARSCLGCHAGHLELGRVVGCRFGVSTAAAGSDAALDLQSRGARGMVYVWEGRDIRRQLDDLPVASTAWMGDLASLGTGVGSAPVTTVRRIAACLTLKLPGDSR